MGSVCIVFRIFDTMEFENEIGWSNYKVHSLDGVN